MQSLSKDKTLHGLLFFREEIFCIKKKNPARRQRRASGFRVSGGVRILIRCSPAERGVASFTPGCPDILVLRGLVLAMQLVDHLLFDMVDGFSEQKEQLMNHLLTIEQRLVFAHGRLDRTSGLAFKVSYHVSHLISEQTEQQKLGKRPKLLGIIIHGRLSNQHEYPLAWSHL